MRDETIVYSLSRHFEASSFRSQYLSKLMGDESIFLSCNAAGMRIIPAGISDKFNQRPELCDRCKRMQVVDVIKIWVGPSSGQ
jgi:hypothetical protein